MIYFYDKLYPLAKLTPQQLSHLPQTGTVIIDGKRYDVQLIPHQPAQPVAIKQRR